MARPWNLVDFVLVVLGGFLGAGVAVAVGILIGGEQTRLVLGLAGQYLGSILALWALHRRRREGESELGFYVEPRDILFLPLGLLLQFVLAVLFLPLSNLLFPDGQAPQQVTESFSGLDTTAARAMAIAVAVVLAPITEELMFRGVLIQALARMSRRTIVVATAAVFAGFHLLGLDPNALGAAALVVLPQLFVVGLALAWLTLRHGRLGPAIFLHSGFNLLAAVVLFLPSELLDQIG